MQRNSIYRIKGLAKVGPKTAEKILKDCKTPYSFYRKVVSEYIKRDGMKIGEYVDENGEVQDITFDWRIEILTNYRLIKLGKSLVL